MAEVVRASASDAPRVASLLHDFNTEFATPTPGVAVLTPRLRRLLARDDLVALCHDDDGLAVVSFRPNPWYDGPVALLDELYVRPDRRGQRIGHALLTAVEQLAVTRGARLVEINVDDEDVDARRFYETHGYVREESGYYAREFE